MTAGDTAIRVSGLEKRYGRIEALRGINFSVPAGQVTGFVGPNGAGKTTTFRALLGLTRPTAGQIEVLDLPVPSNLAEIAKRVGAIIEEPGLIASLSGRTNLEIAADTLGLGHDGIDALLDFVNLADDARRKVNEYSKGMRQRLALAGALLGVPDLLILDEPLDGLDPAGQRVFRSRLRDLADGGTTVVVSSHDMADIEALADHIIVIAKGRIVSEGPLESLLDGGGTRIVVSEPERALTALSAAGFDARSDDGGLLVDSHDREGVLKALAASDVYPTQVTQERMTLESVFLDMTSEDPE